MGASGWQNYIGMKRTGSESGKSNANAIWTDTMKRKKTVTPHFAVCMKNTGYPSSLELHKIYRVIPDEDAAQDGDIRVIDESGEDYLYPAKWFAELKLPQEVQESLMHIA
jgi:hypothetical protein